MRNAIAPDIRRQIWKKYLLNCAFNVTTAYYDCTIGEVAADPQRVGEYRSLVLEAYNVALAKGIRIEHEDVDAVLQALPKSAPGGTSSLKRDLHAGRPSELETFGGYIVTEAERMGLSAPVSRRFYLGCRERAEGRKDTTVREKKNM